MSIEKERAVTDEDKTKDEPNATQTNDPESPDNTGAGTGEEQQGAGERILEMLEKMQKQQDDFKAELNRFAESQALLVKSGYVVREEEDPENDPAEENDNWLDSIDIDKLNI